MLECAAVVLFLLDSSGSISGDQWKEMVRGHAESLVSEQVVRVIEGDAPVAVAFYAFSDRTYPIMDFRVLRTRLDAERAADELTASRRPTESWTLVGHAVTDAIQSITERSPCRTDSPIIDVVSDGESPDAAIASRARDRAQELGIRINVLGVGSDAFNWLNDNVRTADGFYVRVDSMDDIVPALRRKVIMEIAHRD